MRSRTQQIVASVLAAAMFAGCAGAPSKMAAAPEEPASAPAGATVADAPASREESMAPAEAEAPQQAPVAQSAVATGQAQPMPSPPPSQPAAAAKPASPPPAPPPAKAPAGPTAAENTDAGRAAPATPAVAGAAAPKPQPPAPVAVATPTPEPQGTEDYKDYGVNPVTDPAKDRLSTFAIDVDTASYTIARRKIQEGSLPPFQAVRAEEFLNYFDYGYEGPKTGAFGVHLAAAPSPFTQGHHFLRVGVQGKRVSLKERTPVHLVYLVDTSGSMHSPDKIGLAKKSLKLLTDSLKPGDTVALCTYAGSVREVLAPTGIESKGKILAAIEDLTASGSTAMSSGIDLAYNLASRTLVKGHVNRVVVLSDGDANVGPTSHEEILKTIKAAKTKGITLSTVGFGNGNYKDTMMERLANEGDGNYYYIDSDAQAKRVFSEQVGGTLQVIARDVKIQVEFDPSVVKSYRLIGYENRDVADKDFRNDKVDAGEIGAGHSVTAIYDVELKTTAKAPVTVRLRHKAPLGSDQAEETVVKMDTSAISASFDAAPAALRFQSAVVGFAEILRKSPAARDWKLSDVERLARASAADKGDQQEFIAVVRKAVALAGGKTDAAIAK
ncbi:MAG: von Willebrand factor type A domain-containing protein [Polyangiaceae bacterium]|nr:von Willebrand factor type A domain-containing protein [Polyangiaceae bacterium]